VEDETAGDPMSARKWVRRSLRQLSRALRVVGHPASPPTLARLLKARKYSLKANVKRLAGHAHPQRDTQFGVIAAQKQVFLAAGLPVISVDTKKKELIGPFKQAGRQWRHAPHAVLVHDFPEDGAGRAVPYGIYDLVRNQGAVYVGRSADTPRFAVAAIAAWWQEHGHAAYPLADQILILADAGGSNSCHFRMWKHQLQTDLADRLGLTVTVSHYPAHCSKWNPIEHRLFSFISLNWAGQPLRSFDTLLATIPRHHDPHRVDGDGASARGGLPHGRNRLGCRDAGVAPRTSSDLPDLELHAPTPASITAGGTMTNLRCYFLTGS